MTFNRSTHDNSTAGNLLIVFIHENLETLSSTIIPKPTQCLLRHSQPIKIAEFGATKCLKLQIRGGRLVITVVQQPALIAGLQQVHCSYFLQIL